MTEWKRGGGVRNGRSVDVDLRSTEARERVNGGTVDDLPGASVDDDRTERCTGGLSRSWIAIAMNCSCRP